MREGQFTTYKQQSPYDSPRRKSELGLLLIWDLVWTVFCVWTPKPFNGWRLFWLQLFGCKMDGKPFVHQRARIDVPWNLTLHDRSCLGDRAHAYSLGEIELGARSTVAQETYLCAATHKFSDPKLPLQTAKITIGDDAFLAARVFVMPGISIGDGALIGACSVVTQDMPPWTVCAGHPCAPIRKREFKESNTTNEPT
jgi:putative colanic acid biosynthesis acetyltransferase WcaF